MYIKRQWYLPILHQQFFCATLPYFLDGIFLGLVLPSVTEKHHTSNNMTETFLFHCRVTHWNFMPSTCLWIGSSKDKLHSFDIRWHWEHTAFLSYLKWSLYALCTVCIKHEIPPFSMPHNWKWLQTVKILVTVTNIFSKSSRHGPMLKTIWSKAC